MKLAALGAVVAILGVVLGIPGLVAAGAIWVVLGPIARLHGSRIDEAQRAQRDRALAAGGPEPKPRMGGGAFALGTLILLAIGLPSLALGLLEIGFAEDDGAWRWVPIVVGGLITGLAVVSALFLLAGAGLEAAAGAAGVREDPEPPIPDEAAGDPGPRLDALEELRREGRITPAEYEAQRRRILESI